MKSSLYVLVEVDQVYNNFIDLGGGKKLQINNSIDDVETINRVGKIISSPSYMNCSEGDYLLFHHNICRQSWLKGRLRVSNFCVKDNIYYVPATEAMMIKRGDHEDWEALDPFVFVRPIEAEIKDLPNGAKIIEENYKGRKNLQGIVEYPNKGLLSQGVKRGDHIWFQQDSEHEYKIRGEVLYKMRTDDILAIE